MAIYHFSGTVISRSQARSAVACAAYRSANCLEDERFGKTQDYTHKQDVVHTEILLPTQAPNELGDRQTLWNTVERTEKRKDAQLAREFNFALPRELSIEENTELARHFVKEQFVEKGMIADLAIHNDKMPDGQFQPHAHVMLTMREVNADGFGQKVREWNDKDNLIKWREAWAEHANIALEKADIDQKIDHRTLEAQKIDLEPQYKIGASEAKERLARLEDHQRIARENGERLLKDPSIALHAITHQQSTFTRQDIARFVNRHTENAEQFQPVYEKILAQKELVFIGKDAKQNDRFTTKELLKTEKELIHTAEQLSQEKTHAVSEHHQQKAINTKTLSPEQKVAFEHIVNEGQLKTIIGYAGTGKSYLMGAARGAWEAQGYQVHGVTLSGIAAENLEAGSGIKSRTIASREYYWAKDEQHLTRRDILVVDEAGMIGSRQMNRLLQEAHKNNAKVVLLGDPYQLQAIEAGGAFRAVSEKTLTVSLTDIQRQKEPWQREATVAFATGKTANAIEHYQKHDNVHAYATETLAKDNLIQLWNDVRISHPEKTQIMLAYTRHDVKELNERARENRRALRELGEDKSFTTERGKRYFAENDRLYFLKNDRDLGVKNGTLGTIERCHDNLLVVRLDQTDKEKPPRTVTFSTDSYNTFDHGYAATVHKAQGITVDKSYLLASKYFDGHSTYVGMSRHRESADLFYSRETFAHDSDLLRTLGRERQKDISLDYSTQSPEKALQGPFTISKKEADAFDKFIKEGISASKTYKSMETKENDLERFIRDYEKNNPQKAKELADAMRPPHEQRAIEASRHITDMEKTIRESRWPHVQREKLEKYSAEISRDPAAMDYLKKSYPEVSQKIAQHARSYEKQHDRGLSLSR